MTAEEFEILEAMETFGGSFVSALAKAWKLADEFNQAKLKEAFDPYWRAYEDLVAHRKERAAAKEKE